MSDFLTTMSRLGDLPPGLFASRTLMGEALRDVPALPLSSRDITLPAPAIIRPADAILLSRRIDECRRLTMHLHRHRGALDSWGRSIVRELSRWRRAPTAWEADQVAALAEQLHWQERDGVALC